MTADQTKQHPETPAAAATAPSADEKKTFVEPAMSQPVDVLEATTFFQVSDSGGTGFKKGSKP